MKKQLLWIVVLLIPAMRTNCWAQVQLGQIRQLDTYSTEQPHWGTFAVSIAAHAAATSFDAWTSWQRPERNALLADGGRFGMGSVYTKAGIFGGVSVLELVVVKKWGHRHPWLMRACQVANFTTSGMLVSAGVSNLKRR
jgi:hypothetical protein